MNVLCLHGPNLNLLGQREPHLYGAMTLDQINASLVTLGAELGLSVECRQSNHEGQLIDWLQQARGHVHGLLINPAGYTHTSVALRDAVIFLGVPSVEVHLSNVHRREPFRHTSLLADVCQGRLMGFGPQSYLLGLRGLRDLLQLHPPE